MAKYLVRIVLHNYATEQNYNDLHLKMREANFHRFIQDESTKKYYKLPPAEYQGIGDITIDQALRIAQKAASNVYKEYTVFIVEFKGARWDTLEEIQGDPFKYI